MPTTTLIKNARLWQWDSGDDDKKKGQLRQGWFLIEDGIFTQVGFHHEPAEHADGAGQGDKEAAAATAAAALLQLAAAEAQAGEVIYLADSVGSSSSIILPGLQDAHIHVGYMGEAAEYLSLADCTTISAMTQAVQTYSKAHPAKSWLVGLGWDQTPWGRYPTRQDLDAVVADRPVVLYRACWHIVVANSAALKRGGISLEQQQQQQQQPQPEGVDVDATTGVPTGILRETAVPLITDHISETDEEIRKRHFRQALERCLRAGITSVQTNDRKAWGIYSEFQDRDDLPLRVFLTINHEEMESEMPRGPIPATHPLPSLLSCPRVKLYSDGSLGAETAALRLPYVGTDNKGILIHTLTSLTDKIRTAHQAGFQLEIHAIGDRALATVLDALEAAKVPPAARPVITHCQVMGDDLMERMALMGVVANIQPSFVGTDCKFVQARIPKEVQRTSYCWKTLMERGIHCAGGSDAPVEDCSPLLGIYDAMHRLPHSCKNAPAAAAATSGTTTNLEEMEEEENTHHHQQQEEEGLCFLPDECLTFSEALWLYTVGASYACHSEKGLGRIEPGYLADFIVVDRDVTVPQTSNGGKTSKTRHPLLDDDVVQQVWVGGKCRFDRGKEEKTTGEDKKQTTLEGPYISGKNGWPGHQSHLLRGKRLGMSCCGH